MKPSTPLAALSAMAFRRSASRLARLTVSLTRWNRSAISSSAVATSSGGHRDGSTEIAIGQVVDERHERPAVGGEVGRPDEGPRRGAEANARHAPGSPRSRRRKCRRRRPTRRCSGSYSGRRQPRRMYRTAQGCRIWCSRRCNSARWPWDSGSGSQASRSRARARCLARAPTRQPAVRRLRLPPG